MTQKFVYDEYLLDYKHTFVMDCCRDCLIEILDNQRDVMIDGLANAWVKEKSQVALTVLRKVKFAPSAEVDSEQIEEES